MHVYIDVSLSLLTEVEIPCGREREKDEALDAAFGRGRLHHIDEMDEQGAERRREALLKVWIICHAESENLMVDSEELWSGVQVQWVSGIEDLTLT